MIGAGGVLKVEADRYTKACQNSYLNPHPVPPRTIAARRIAPAMDPIMILVPLGPAQRKEGGGRRVRRRREGQKQNNTTKNTRRRTASTPYINHINERRRERQMTRYLQTQRERMKRERRRPARGVEVGEQAGEQGRSGRQQLFKESFKKGECFITLFSIPLSRFQLDTLLLRVALAFLAL